MGKFVISGFCDEIAPDVDSQIKGLQKLNINYAELRNIDEKSVCAYSDEKAKELKKVLDAGGISVSALGTYIGKQPIEESFTHIEDFKRALEVASILETKNLRMFSFYLGEQTPEAYRNEVLERWQKFIDAAKGYDVLLLHENEKGIYGDTAERNLDIVTSLNSEKVKLIFDCANYIQCGVKTYPFAWDMLKEHVAYMHIKDALAIDESVVPAGHGDANYKAILSDLKSRINGDMFLSLEPHLSNFAGFASLEQNDAKLPDGNNFEKFELAKNSLDEILSQI